MFIGRSKASNLKKDDRSIEIDQPSLCIYGTSIPYVFYSSLSSTMLDNGLFSRIIIIEAEHVTTGYEPGIMTIPESLVSECKSMWELKPAVAGVGARRRVPNLGESNGGAKGADV